MYLLRTGAPRPGVRRPPRTVLLTLPAALLLAAAHPAASLAAALAGGAAAPGADPDTGYWVELGLVTLVTAAAGIVMKLRNKPEP